MTVPSEVRKELGIARGDHLSFEVVGEDEAAVRVLKARKVDFVDAYLATRAARDGAPVCTFGASDFERLPTNSRRPGAVRGDEAASRRPLRPRRRPASPPPP